MREPLTGFYRFNIVCYDEEGMNEIEYLYDNYVKPQLTDKQEIRRAIPHHFGYCLQK